MRKNIVLILVLGLLIGALPTSIVVAGETKLENPSQFEDLAERLSDSIKEIAEKTDEYFKEKIRAFTDMGRHWADVTIGKLVEIGVISGYTDGTFKPDNTITRTEFAKIVRTALKMDLVEGNSFDDTKTHWAKNEINTLVANKGIVVSEYKNGFGPDVNITRVEMAKMIVRSMGLGNEADANSKVETGFYDIDDYESGDGLNGFVYVANKYGIVKGYGDYTFKAHTPATRAEASQMILNMLDTINGGSGKLNTADPTIDGFIAPRVSVAYNDDGWDYHYYKIMIDNYDDYTDDYEFKTIILNYPQLNTSEIPHPNFVDYIIQHPDSWKDAELIKRNKGMVWRLSKKYYTTREDEKTFELYPGLEIEFKVVVSNGSEIREYLGKAVVPHIDFKG
jgi:hypothetical protein